MVNIPLYIQMGKRSVFSRSVLILSDQIKMNSSYCNPKVESYHGAPE